MPFISFSVLKSKGLIFNEHFRFPETFCYLQLNTVQKKAENATFGALHYAEIVCTPVDDTGNNMLAKTPRKGFWGGLGGWQKSFIGHLFWYWGNLQMRDPPMSKQHTNHMTVEPSFNDIWSFTPVFVRVEQWSVIHCGPLCFIACLSLLDSHCTGYHYSWAGIYNLGTNGCLHPIRFPSSKFAITYIFSLTNVGRNYLVKIA